MNGLSEKLVIFAIVMFLAIPAVAQEEYASERYQDLLNEENQEEWVTEEEFLSLLSRENTPYPNIDPEFWEIMGQLALCGRYCRETKMSLLEGDFLQAVVWNARLENEEECPPHIYAIVVGNISVGTNMCPNPEGWDEYLEEQEALLLSEAVVQTVQEELIAPEESRYALEGVENAEDWPQVLITRAHPTKTAFKFMACGMLCEHRKARLTTNPDLWEEDFFGACGDIVEPIAGNGIDPTPWCESTPEWLKYVYYRGGSFFE